MSLGKLTQSLPVRNFMSISPLIMGDRLAGASLFLSFQPQVERVAADVQHSADFAFAGSTLNRRNRFLAQVFTIGGRHWYYLMFSLSLSSS